MNKTKRISGVGLVLGCLGLTCLGAVACGDEKDGSLLDMGSGADGSGASTGKGGSSLMLGPGGDGSGDMGGDGSAVGGGEGMSCVPIVIAAEPPIVNVLLVVDKSGSMED